jgi:co-chaperonin GroES (HSP10)
MNISNEYILVEKLEEKKTEGFKTVNVQDEFIYKAKVVGLSTAPLFMGDRRVEIGDTVIFAKYSPDTHEIEIFEGKKGKFINRKDVLAVL